jgi:hypothetical protein
MWLVLAIVLVALACLALGYWLGQAQSSCALHAARAMSAVTNQTAGELLKSSGLSTQVTECVSASSRSEQAVALLEKQVESMGETLTQLLAAFVQRNMIRMVDPSSGLQAGEIAPHSRNRPPPMPRDSIPEA